MCHFPAILDGFNKYKFNSAHCLLHDSPLFILQLVGSAYYHKIHAMLIGL